MSTKRIVSVKKQNRNKIGKRADKINTAGDMIVKRMTLASTLATGAGTAIPVTAFTSGQVQSNPATEWASFAARYQEYRVRKIRVTGRAINPIQTATSSHSDLYMGDYLGSSTPASAAQVLSDENVRVVATCKDFAYETSWRRNPNAKLWSSSTLTLPAPNQFSCVFASPATPALTTATTYYAVVVEWEVEFRGSQ